MVDKNLFSFPENCESFEVTGSNDDVGEEGLDAAEMMDENALAFSNESCDDLSNV
jgi:hypothetical protein